MAEKEYIERDSIYSRVKRHTNPYGKPTIDYESGVKVLDMIKQEPAADVAPVVHGEWVDIFSLDKNENVIATCNYCNERGKVRTARNEWGVWYINSPRCPNCGAKMKGE